MVERWIMYVLNLLKLSFGLRSTLNTIFTSVVCLHSMSSWCDFYIVQCQCRIQIPAEIRKIKWWKWRFGTVSDPITLIKSTNQNLAWEHWPIGGWGWGSVSAAVSWTLEHCSWHRGLVWFSSESRQHQSHNFHCQGLRSNLHTQTDAAVSTAARGCSGQHYLLFSCRYWQLTDHYVCFGSDLQMMCLMSLLWTKFLFCLLWETPAAITFDSIDHYHTTYFNL